MKRIGIKRGLKNTKYVFQYYAPNLWYWLSAKYKRIKNKSKTELVLNAYYQMDLDFEQKKCIQYISKNGIDFRPYEWSNEYMCRSVRVFKDPVKKLYFVMHLGKRLYFPRQWAKSDIFTLYNELCLEQDPRSSHCYFNDHFQIDSGSLFVDVGAAEGLIALENIEKVRHCFLIECEAKWIEALQATFEPYADKVTIISKFASDHSSSSSIMLNDLLKLRT